MAARSRVLAWQKMIERLKGINGASGGYWVDVGRRVYERLVLPEDQNPKPILPYLCVPLVATGPRWEQEHDWFLCRWHQPVFGFVAEVKRDPGTSSSALDVLHLQEDVLRALFTDQDLGGTCEDLALVEGGDDVAAVDPADLYGEFQMVFQVRTRLQRSNLGPLGA